MIFNTAYIDLYAKAFLDGKIEDDPTTGFTNRREALKYDLTNWFKENYPNETDYGAILNEEIFNQFLIDYDKKIYPEREKNNQTSVKLLDQALYFFSEGRYTVKPIYAYFSYYKFNQQLREFGYKEITRDEYDLILKKLIEDNYLYEHKESKSLQITFKGKLQNQLGGYHYFHAKEERLESLARRTEKSTADTARWTATLSFWTKVLGIATTALVLLELTTWAIEHWELIQHAYYRIVELAK